MLYYISDNKLCNCFLQFLHFLRNSCFKHGKSEGNFTLCLLPPDDSGQGLAVHPGYPGSGLGQGNKDLSSGWFTAVSLRWHPHSSHPSKPHHHVRPKTRIHHHTLPDLTSSQSLLLLRSSVHSLKQRFT